MFRFYFFKKGLKHIQKKKHLSEREIIRQQVIFLNRVEEMAIELDSQMLLKFWKKEREKLNKKEMELNKKENRAGN